MTAVEGRGLAASAETQGQPARNEPQTPRLAGIDVARGVAVVAMYAAHLGPDPFEGGLGTFFRVFDGRSAALFAVLAGVSISLMSGGPNPKRGRQRTIVGLRLGTRAPLVVAIGLGLTNLGTGYLVILAYYGVCFVLAIPCLRLRARMLAVAAVFTATVVPFISFAIRAQVAPRDLPYEWPDVTFGSLFSSASLGETLQVLALTGTFPAVGLMSYVFAGMAIARLDLSSERICRMLVGWGAALAALAYTASWLAKDVFGGMRAIYDALAPAAAQAGMPPEEFFFWFRNHIHGTPPTTSLAWQTLSSAHSYTPFDFLACIGIAASVIGACQLLMARFPRLLRPLADLGGVILTAYIVHFVAIWLIFGDDPTFSVVVFLEFTVVAVAAAVAWRRWIGRGPFEWLLHVASKWPNKVLRSGG